MTFRFDLSHEFGVAVITLPAQLKDSLVINGLTGDILAWMEQQQPEKVVFDFEQVRGMSSEVINLMIMPESGRRATGGKIVLCGLSPEIREVFQLVKLDGILLEIRGDRLAAMGVD